MGADSRVNSDWSKSNWKILGPAGLLRYPDSTSQAEVLDHKTLGPLCKILDLIIGFWPSDSLPITGCYSTSELVSWPIQEYLITFYTRICMDCLKAWSVQGVLETVMRMLEKSLTASHPFHAKLVCHWPQINYQETGREKMWPTPNCLYQHSLHLLIHFPSCSALPCYSHPL